MCQSLAFSGHGLTVIATDTRWTFDSTDGRASDAQFHDFGAKLRRVPGGWAAATGDARLGALGLRVLAERGIEDAQVELADAFAEARDHCSRIGRELPLTHFLIGSDSGLIEIVSSAPGESRRIERPPNGRLSLHASWSPGLPLDGGVVRAKFAKRITKARHVLEAVHALAMTFVEAREWAGDSMSGEVEIGLSKWSGRTGYARGAAAAVAAAAAAGKLVLAEAPAMSPWPELPAERVLFPMLAGAGS